MRSRMSLLWLLVAMPGSVSAADVAAIAESVALYVLEGEACRLPVDPAAVRVAARMKAIDASAAERGVIAAEISLRGMLSMSRVATCAAARETRPTIEGLIRKMDAADRR